VKYFFYTILLLASLVLFGAIVNPPLVQQGIALVIQQGAAIIGLELPQDDAEPDENGTSEDQIAQFLAQYSQAHQNNTQSAEAVPVIVVPEPAQPPIPQNYGLSPSESASFPAPVYSSPAPVYAENRSASWDGEASTPIHGVPIDEQPFPQQNDFQQHYPSPPAADWLGSAQPQQAAIPDPPQPVYANNQNQHVFGGAPPLNPFAPANTTAYPGVAPAAYTAQPGYMPPPSPVVPPTPPAHTLARSTIQTPGVLIEDVPVYGTEMVARVGKQVILMGDILPKLRREALKFVAENIKRMPEEERAKIPPKEIEQAINMFVEKSYPAVLQEQILFALVYNDFEKYKSRDEIKFLNDKIGETFDRSEIPEMMKEFNVENVVDLKKRLEEQLGSSLDKERRLWIREQIARQWVGQSVQRAAGECTPDEMMEFYEKNKAAMFTTSARARWQEMVVLLSKHSTEQEALKKISWMGNQVVGGAPFEKIAEVNSDGSTASKGGVWDWTTKGNLASAELEQAIFTQPVGQLSPAIIRSDKGLHIIRVLERQEENVIPFKEAQVTIRENMKNQRTQWNQEEYFSDLRRTFPVQIIKPRIDFNVSNSRPANYLK